MIGTGSRGYSGMPTAPTTVVVVVGPKPGPPGSAITPFAPPSQSWPGAPSLSVKVMVAPTMLVGATTLVTPAHSFTQLDPAGMGEGAV